MLKTSTDSFTIFKCCESDISKCASIVENGGVIVYPTDTIYGIGCNPYKDEPVERIFKIKGRDKNKAFPILASNIKDIEKIVSLGEVGKLLSQTYWPGSLTIICPIIDKNISSKLTAGKMSIGVRIPNNSCSLSLLKQCRYIVGTSANRSGEKPARTPSEVISSSLRGFDALLDGGSVETGVESTIIELLGPFPKIIREGAIRSQEIYKVLIEADIITDNYNEFQSGSFHL